MTDATFAGWNGLIVAGDDEHTMGAVHAVLEGEYDLVPFPSSRVPNLEALNGEFSRRHEKAVARGGNQFSSPLGRHLVLVVDERTDKKTDDEAQAVMTKIAREGRSYCVSFVHLTGEELPVNHDPMVAKLSVGEPTESHHTGSYEFGSATIPLSLPL
jgi:hypothetical protein